MIDYVKASNLNLKHGFFARNGGVSEGVYSSLNVNSNIGDRSEDVLKNRELICEHLGFDYEKSVFLNALQHTDQIFVADKDSERQVDGYDIIITTEKDIAIGISVADCLPIIITDEKTVLAVVHAGWRGLKHQTIKSALQKIKELSPESDGTLKAAIGPSIGPDSYEVKDDVLSEFESKYTKTIEGKTFLDMWEIAKDQLAQGGVTDVENLKTDTFTDTRFYSYRREFGKTGRFMAIAAL